MAGVSPNGVNRTFGKLSPMRSLQPHQFQLRVYLIAHTPFAAPLFDIVWAGGRMLMSRPIAERVSPAPPTISLFFVDERRKGTPHAKSASASVLEVVP